MGDQIRNTMDHLTRNGFGVQYFETMEEARAYIAGQISPDQTVGFSGSATLDQMGLYDALVEKGCSVFWHWKRQPNESVREVMKKAIATDVYCTGINAITEDGRIVNVDGTGNRLAGMLACFLWPEPTRLSKIMRKP